MKMDLVLYEEPIPLSYSQPSITQIESDEFVVEKKKEKNLKNNIDLNDMDSQLGLVGLTNLGNTCFMNAGLQCLFNNKQLVNFFLNTYKKNSSIYSFDENSLTFCFLNLIKKVWNKSRDYNVIKPNEFKEMISQDFSQFQGYRQHDCQEFLTLLLGTLHDQINSNNKKNLGDSFNLLKLESSESKVNELKDSNQNLIKKNNSVANSDTLNDINGDNIDNFFENNSNNKNSFLENIENQNTENEMKINEKESNEKLKKVVTSNSFTSIKKSKKRYNSSSSDSDYKLSLNSSHKNLTTGCFLDEEDDNYIMQNNSPKRIKMDVEQNCVKENIFDQLDEKAFGEKKWNSYLNKNKSIIIETFQGQFKSTVKCFKCSTLSVTFEPFMYLPVSLPNILEKQIFITFVPKSTNACYNQEIKPMKKYLITINKHDKLEKLSDKLKSLLVEDKMANEDLNLNFAEVEENYVSKVLDKNVYLKCVDDKFKNLYAFEMNDSPYAIPFSNVLNDKSWEQEQSNLDFTIGPQLPNNHEILNPDNYFDLNNGNSFINNTNFMNSLTFNSDQNLNSQSNFSVANNEDTGFSDKTNNSNNQSTEDKKNNDSKDSDIHCKNEKNSTNSFDEFLNNLPEIEVDENLPKRDCSFESNDKIKKESLNGNFDNSNLFSVPLSCAICLEEKASSELLIHSVCSCQLCSTCLDMTVKHCSENDRNFLCPTCSQLIEKTDFIPFGNKKESFPTNVYTIPVLFRIYEKRSSTNYKLVVRPILINLPNLINGRELYEIIDKFVPCLCTYSLNFVSKSGQKCSRCNWDCNGCEIARVGDVYIKPNDNIAVEFESSFFQELDSSIPDSLKKIISHESVFSFKKPEKITLHNCLKSFNQSEILDDDNPWFCKNCNSNQKAKKTLTIWRIPNTFIVYLKRFIFYDMNSIKLDEPVEYPLKNFDLSPYFQVKNGLADENSDNKLIYDLKSIVCHTGSVSSGHYTAFSKSAWNNKWYHFNDENVVELDPSSTDERAYILFYQKSDYDLSLDFFKNNPSF